MGSGCRAKPLLEAFIIGGVTELQLDAAGVGELELFLAGAYAPETAFRLPAAQRFTAGTKVLLRDPNNVRLAVFTAEAEGCGAVEVIEKPRHADFTGHRLTAEEARRRVAGSSLVRAVALRGFLSIETERALLEGGARAIVHVIEDGPVDHFPRVRAALAAAGDRLLVNILPVAPRDPARVLRNYGAVELVEESGDTYRPEVRELMDRFLPPRRRQGFCVWFTGLPSAGKSTIAEQLAVLLRERGRLVTMLDGDVVRMHLSKGLGFSREDRDANIRRIGFVAGEIVRHHGVAICAAVSPYEASREEARRMVGADRFVLVHVDTPQPVCETRDVKGYYARARSGALAGFTGVDDPYETPLRAELTLQTEGVTPQQNARAVLEYLIADGRIDEE